MEVCDPIVLFNRSVQRWAERPALHLGGRSITYAELDAWSNAIARRLMDLGMAGQRVAFVATKQPSSYAGLLGILKCGCSYVPLPPDGPQARWSSMLQQADVRCVLGDLAGEGLCSVPLEEGTGEAVHAPVDPAAEAYVLFTSGSTGGPKGVSVSRGNVAAYLQHMLSTHELHEHDRFSQFFALTFDLSVHDLFLCWSVGACSCVPAAEDHLRAVSFARDERITVWFSVPSLAVLMRRTRALSKGSLPDLRLVFFCGEALTWPVIDAFAQAAPKAQLFNLYGPTEATVAITSYPVPKGGPQAEGNVPLGRPFTGSEVRLEGEELLLSGPQLAAGYVDDPAATARAFTTDGSGKRWYRTGDRVRMDADGTLHFLGRLDDQVKIMGHRVEPAEVDAVLAPLVVGATVVTIPHRSAEAVRLFTFIDAPADVAGLMNELRRSLPVYMLPEKIISVERMPVTRHGKLDRAALLAMITHG